MISEASHKNFSNWELTTIQLDRPIKITDKAVQLTGEIVGGSVWFPLSCVNVVEQFEVEVPKWLLYKKGLQYLN